MRGCLCLRFREPCTAIVSGLSDGPCVSTSIEFFLLCDGLAFRARVRRHDARMQGKGSWIKWCGRAEWCSLDSLHRTLPKELQDAELPLHWTERIFKHLTTTLGSRVKIDDCSKGHFVQDNVEADRTNLTTPGSLSVQDIIISEQLLHLSLILQEPLHPPRRTVVLQGV